MRRLSRQLPTYQVALMAFGIFSIGFIGSASTLNFIDPKSENTSRNVEVTRTEPKKVNTSEESNTQTGSSNQADSSEQPQATVVAEEESSRSAPQAVPVENEQSQAPSPSSSAETATASPSSTNEPAGSQDPQSDSNIVDDIVPSTVRSL